MKNVLVTDKMEFVPSTRVEKGALLFRIEPAPYEAKLQEAQATLASDKADLSLARATLKRKENAYKAHAVSEVDVLEARANKDKAMAAIKSGQAEVNQARINLGYTSVTTPISGRVSRNLVDVGNLVGQGEATILTTVVNDDPIYVYFSVSENDLLRFRKESREKEKQNPGQRENIIEMGLGDETGYPNAGVVDYVDNQVDPGTGTITVRGKFDNPDGIIVAGLFARVRFPVDIIEKGLLVPEAALGSDQKGRYLLVVNGSGEVEYRSVELGPLEKDLRTITKGITATDRVIVQGLQRVRPGVKANARTAKEQEAAKKQADTQNKDT